MVDYFVRRNCFSPSNRKASGAASIIGERRLSCKYSLRALSLTLQTSMMRTSFIKCSTPVSRVRQLLTKQPSALEGGGWTTDCSTRLGKRRGLARRTTRPGASGLRERERDGNRDDTPQSHSDSQVKGRRAKLRNLPAQTESIRGLVATGGAVLFVRPIDRSREGIAYAPDEILHSLQRHLRRR